MDAVEILRDVADRLDRAGNFVSTNGDIAAAIRNAIDEAEAARAEKQIEIDFERYDV